MSIMARKVSVTGMERYFLPVYCSSRTHSQKDIKVSLMLTTRGHHSHIGQWFTDFVSEIVNKSIMFFIFLVAGPINSDCFQFVLSAEGNFSGGDFFSVND